MHKNTFSPLNKKCDSTSFSCEFDRKCRLWKSSIHCCHFSVWPIHNHHLLNLLLLLPVPMQLPIQTAKPAVLQKILNKRQLKRQMKKIRRKQNLQNINKTYTKEWLHYVKHSKHFNNLSRKKTSSDRKLYKNLPLQQMKLL